MKNSQEIILLVVNAWIEGRSEPEIQNNKRSVFKKDAAKIFLNYVKF